MKLFKYLSYQHYQDAQELGNLDHPGISWATEGNIKFICSKLIKPIFGICHGTRYGKEIEWFKKHLKYCAVVGTEIASSAETIPNTIRHDFHKPHGALFGADFVYTNALDHAYDPELALTVWRDQVLSSGFVIIEHTAQHETGGTARDPFAASLRELFGIIKKAGMTYQEWDAPDKKKLAYSKLIFCRRAR